MNIKVQIKPQERIGVALNKPQERIGVALKDVIKVNTATGTKTINANGLYDITEYKYADVFVEEQNLQEKDVIITENGIYEVLPDDDYFLTRVEVDVNVPVPEGYIIPEGTLDISENGEHNVREYERVKVDVPIPEGYIVPAGEIQVNKEGTYDVTEFKDAVFSVQKTSLQITPTKESQQIQPDQDTFFNEVTVDPIPAEYIIPEGKKEITNTDEIDITNYASVQVVDNNLKPENIAENIEVLGIKGTFKGGIDTNDGTITPDKVLEGAIGYSQEQRIIGIIKTYDGSNSKYYPSSGTLKIRKEGTYDVKDYDVVIVDLSSVDPGVLTEEEIQALNEIIISSDDINNTIISYDETVLDMEIKYENEELIIDNNMEQVSFRINEDKELEVTY